MTEGYHGIRISERVVPHPVSISREAQAAFARLVDPDGVPTNARHDLPSPDDAAAWTAMKTAVDAQYGAAMGSLAGAPRSVAQPVTVGEATVHVVASHPVADGGRAVIDLHGGALVFGGGEACRVGARRAADVFGVRCYGVDYRTPPDHPFPAALDDCVAAYRFALERHRAGNLAIVGRSAGGNLACALLLRARAEGLAMPASLVLLSPEVDLTESGDSFQTNSMIDAVLPRSLMAANRLYANGADLADPYLSPLFGDLRGFPPTILQTGTRDLFLSNTVRLHRALRRARVSADLHVFEAMPHGGFLGGTPEDVEVEAELSRFVASHWEATN